MAKQDINFEDVSFSRAFVEGHKGVESFLEAMSDKTHNAVLEGDNREAQLRELYQTVHAKKQEPVKAQETPAVGVETQDARVQEEGIAAAEDESLTSVKRGRKPQQ